MMPGRHPLTIPLGYVISTRGPTEAREPYKYKAFISNSRAMDGEFAPAIQAALYGFAKPFYRLRAVRIFRDKTKALAVTSVSLQ